MIIYGSGKANIFENLLWIFSKFRMVWKKSIIPREIDVLTKRYITIYLKVNGGTPYALLE